MPISSFSAASFEKRRSFDSSVGSIDNGKTVIDSTLLSIEPALPPRENTRRLLKKSYSTLLTYSEKGHDVCWSADQTKFNSNTDGSVHVSRTVKEKEENPDRICLDRKGLTSIPVIDKEPKLRLLSMQHNLINSLDAFKAQNFPFLVFLDVYDNQLEKIHGLETLTNLRVLLMGKNRIKRMEGLTQLTKVEVLDLHGNKITHIAGLTQLTQLKVLNLAGNQIRIVAVSDLEGLVSLQELNLKRNRLKKLLGFAQTPKLLKLFLNSNDLQDIDDMYSLAKATNIREISIDNNPISLAGDCVSFLVSYLPHLIFINGMQITEQVRKAAMSWRRNKELSNANFMDLTSDIKSTAHREEVISNARTNWELLRSQSKRLTSPSCVSNIAGKLLKPDTDFILTSFNKVDVSKTKRFQKLVKTKVPILPDKNKKIMTRTSSQDTENSQNTSSSNTSSSGCFRLPPILVPIIDKLESRDEIRFNMLKRSGSLSSLGPNVDSSVSSLFSNTDMSVSSPNSTGNSSSEDENEKDDIQDLNLLEDDKQENLLNSKITDSIKTEVKLAHVNLTTMETSSILSTNTSNSSSMTAASSNSSSNMSKRSTKSFRSIKSAAGMRVNPTKLKNRAVTAKPKKPASPQLQAEEREREQGGDYLVEICGRHLNIYGQGALRFIEKQWNVSKARDVTTVNFNYSSFNCIVGIFGKLKQRFPNSEHFVFKETNMYCLGQLNALAEIQGFVSLHIHNEGNPITEKDWKSYAIFRLAHWGLKRINDKEISEDDIKHANEKYQSLSDLVLWSLPDVLLEPLLTRLHLDMSQTRGQNVKKWLQSIDPALKGVVSKEALQWKKNSPTHEDLLLRQNTKVHMEKMIQNTCNAIYKLRQLDRQWSDVFHEGVRNIVLDYSHLDMYMKKKIQEVQVSGLSLP